MTNLAAAVLLLAMASTPAVAADDSPAGQAAARLPEILVTARRRPENLQSVPAAVSAVAGDLIDMSYTINISQLSLLVPSLNYSSANPRNTAFTIRGLGSSVVAVSQANDGLEPGVGFYVDQVYHGRPATAAFDFVDIGRIEVLRGPQGTLFGKNTTAGAIHITSRAPSFDWQGQGEISFGGLAFVQAKAAISGPIIADSLAFRLSGITTKRSGVIHNINSGRDQNNLNNQAIRGQLLWRPTASLRLRLSADWSSFKSECCTQVYLRTGSSQRPSARQFPTLAAGLGYLPASLNPYDRLTDIDAPLAVDTNEGGVALVADWDLGQTTLTAVTAWRFWNWNAANDRDYTGIPIQLVQGIPSRQDQISHEIRLASKGESRFGYVIGLYALRQVISGRPISIYGPQATYWLLGAAPQFPSNLLDGYGQDGHTRISTDSYASFGELNWRFTDRLTVTGGLRYTIEHKVGDYSTTVHGGLVTTVPALVNAKLSILRPQSYGARDDDGSLSGRANAAYQFTNGIFGYVSYARGFKSGGINMSGLPLNALNQPVLSTAVINAERNSSWEGGLKTELFDQRLRLNFAVYHTAIRDFQATIVDATQTVALRGYLANIPKVEVRGFEIDATATPFPGLQLRAATAFADGIYADYPKGPCPLELQSAATTACNLTGQRLSGLPRWSTTLGGDYTLPVKAGALIFHIDSNWRSSAYGDPTLSRFTLIDGYNLTNASIGYRSAEGWRATVFARNLLNADYIQNLTTQAGNSGLILGTPSDPRVIGVTLGIDL